MKNPAGRRPTNFRLYSVLIGLILSAAVLAVSSQSVDSNSQTPTSKQRVSADNQNTPGKATRGIRFAGWTWTPSFAPVAGETVEVFAADCVTPKAAFNLGETVCAKTDGIDLTVPNNHYMNWVDSQLNETNGGSITQNPQYFLFVPPTNDTWKATVGRVTPADSSIIGNPPLFTVSDGGAMSTFAANCTTPKTTFVLGETVCARATGLVGFRFAWQDAAGYVERRTDITLDPQTDLFELPSTQTSVIGGITVDNRGQWRASAVTSRNSVRRSAFFTVTDPQNPVVDLSITKSLLSNNPQQGGLVQYEVIITNYGPDDAANAHFVDDTFTGATFDSVTETSGLGFICTGSGSADCLLASLPAGTRATFLLNFTAGSAGASLQNTAEVTSDTTEQNTLDNTFTTAVVLVGSGTPPPVCTLNCPNNINAIANTEENSQRGAHVSFAATVVSDEETCGTVTTTPASGSFFPVGTTTVTSTGDNGGSCSFTITVEDQGTNPPTISCPANPPAANANADCEAVVTITNPTVTGNNVTFSGARSDGRPMYNCDCFPNSPNQLDDACDIHGACTRRADAPFQSGTTTITWIAYSHDIPGPYATPEIEEAHRTGAASCTVTVIVYDTTPPVISAQSSAVSADANCQAPVPDYSNDVSDNCSCSSTDDSEDCRGRQRISLTQTPAAGTMVGLGPHTIHLVANDGASNPGPDGIPETADDGTGNVTTKDITFTVNDTTAPVITCPSNISGVPAEPGTCAAHVTPGTATATDNCDSTPTISGTRSDGRPLTDTYPGGTTTITWRATDDPGNYSECTQTITVVDTQPPTISCQANIIADFNPAVNGATVTYTTPVGADNCPGATTVRTAGPASGSVFPLGTTTVTFQVTDGALLTASCSFKVTVALTSIIGLDSVTMTGAGYVDSYSSAGGYPATKGSLANVLSNGTITMGNSAKIWGNARSTRAGINMTGASQITGNATAGTTVTTSGSASVGGTRTNNAMGPVMTLPAVPACGPPYSSAAGISGTYSYNASTGDLTLGGVNIATLANGNYCFHNVTLGNSSQLKVNGPVAIRLTGILNTSGATSLNNTTQIPNNLRILSSYSGSNGVVLGNSTAIYAVLYSPNTGLNISGAVPLFGTFAGKTLIIGNSGAIHYDTQLKSAWPDIWTLIMGP